MLGEILKSCITSIFKILINKKNCGTNTYTDSKTRYTLPCPPLQQGIVFAVPCY